MTTRRAFNKGLFAVTVSGAIGGSLVPASAARTLIYGNAGNINSASNTFARKWLDIVTEKTGGELVFDIKAGTIGSEKEILDGTALGTVQIYNGAYTGLREFDVFYAPYFVRDSGHALKVANELLYDQINAAVGKRYAGVRYLSVARAGPWKLFTKKKLETFDDMKGLKIRAPEIEGVVAGLEQIGAKPTVIPFNELYGALQQGVVDGMATLGNLMISQKFYEVVKYCYPNDWGIGLDKQIINQATWDSLTGDQQKILVDTFKELEPQDFFRATEEAEIENFKKWREFNGEDSTPTLDAAAAQAVLKPAIAKLADDIFGPGTYDKVQAVQA
jgi:TRAP-type C4-dicarboxylate transport system substrate-binding protein